MMQNKKGQGTAIAVVLLVIILILIAGAIFIILLRPDFISGFVSGNTINTNTNTVAVCTSPYIKSGIECCLDLNYNSVCDKDENYRVIVCSSPYIEKNGACCPDMNSNKICDEQERIYDFNYDSRYYSRDYDDRYRDSRDDYEITGASIDYPFDITDAELDRDLVEIELENEGDEDYMIESIDISRCGFERVNKILEEDERKTFFIDCDDDLTRDSDLEVRYSELNDDRIFIADGEIEVDRN